MVTTASLCSARSSGVAANLAPASVKGLAFSGVRFLSLMHEMRAAGKGIIGMKILGQGDMRDRVDEALKYALSLGLLDVDVVIGGGEVRTKDVVEPSPVERGS